MPVSFQPISATPDTFSHTSSVVRLVKSVPGFAATEPSGVSFPNSGPHGLTSGGSFVVNRLSPAAGEYGVFMSQ